MGQTPSIPTDLSRKVKVIGAGYSRTGTVSFALALERLLDGPVCHSGTSMLLREEVGISQRLTRAILDYVKQWIEIQRKSADREFVLKRLRALTAGFVATTDVPANAFTEELVELYPDAVVICSTRDQASWWRSSEALMKNTSFWWLGVVFWPMPTLRFFGQWVKTIGERYDMIYRPELGPNGTIENHELLQIHEKYVRRVVPKEKLVFYNVKEGWKPLCDILKCPIPDEPFPRANDADSMQEFFEKLVKAAILRWLQIFAGVGVVTTAGVYVWKAWAL